MITAKSKQKIIVSAVIKRKNGTIEDVGVLTEIKTPSLLQKFINTIKRKCE